MDPAAFLRPIAPFALDAAKGAASDGLDGPLADPVLCEPTLIPSLFRAHVYVWDDTTLREVLEEILASSAAARAVLLPPRPAAVQCAGGQIGKGTGNGAEGSDVERDLNINSNKDSVCKNHEGEESAKQNPDIVRPNGSVEDEDNEDGDEDENDEEAEENEPLSKRERTEREDQETPMERQDAGEAMKKRPRRRRRPAMPGAKVSISQVIPDSSGKPRIDPLCVLRVDRPIFHRGDLTTIREMRNFGGARAFKSGNLIVIAPTVRHYKPSSSAQTPL